MRALLTLLLAILLTATATLGWAAPQQDRRVALVIGNSAYQNTPGLPNPRNDAEDLAGALRRVGFEVVEGRDLDRAGMIAVIQRFASLTQEAEAALVFYAGHGVQYRGQNFLVPVDARLENEESIQFGEAIPVTPLVSALDRARGARILILDACRNLPLAGGRTSLDVLGTEGLAKIARRGMVVAYAAQANAVAYDGKGRNSVFTGALVKEIEEPGLEITQVFRRVGAMVERQTAGKQTPELSSSLYTEFYFNRGETDVQAWERLGDRPPADELRAFIARFPNSPYALLAKERLDFRAYVEEQRHKAEEKAKRHKDEEDAARLRQEQAQRQEEQERLRQKQEQAQQRKDEDERLRQRQEQAQRQKEEQERWSRLEEEQKRRAKEDQQRQEAAEKQTQLEAKRREDERKQADREARERAKREQLQKQTEVNRLREEEKQRKIAEERQRKQQEEEAKAQRRKDEEQRQTEIAERKRQQQEELRQQAEDKRRKEEQTKAEIAASLERRKQEERDQQGRAKPAREEREKQAALQPKAGEPPQPTTLPSGQKPPEGDEEGWRKLGERKNFNAGDPTTLSALDCAEMEHRSGPERGLGPCGEAAPKEKPSAVPVPSNADLDRAASAQLRRIGCFRPADRGSASMKTALGRYRKQLGLAASERVTETLVDELKTRPEGFCPPECGAGQRLEDNRCVAATKTKRQPVAEPEPERKPVAEPKSRRRHPVAEPEPERKPVAAPKARPKPVAEPEPKRKRPAVARSYEPEEEERPARREPPPPQKPRVIPRLEPRAAPQRPPRQPRQRATPVSPQAPPGDEDRMKNVRIPGF